MLLLLGLLAGVFGMHALGPGNAVAVSSHPSPHHPHGRAVSAPMTAMTAMTAMTDESVCHGADSGGGHAQHADPTCASGAVGAGPVLPAPMPDPSGTAVADDLDGRSLAAAPEGGRAPPSLAELQILRT
ncbi:DUF6153 family protein [Streptomyces sp. T21Q-yed]|nr:DUF6153 family protein [Streptomyces sp. T21Q-yed]MDF3142519.1 DUF6153 family protein [Streptomyces sp. T21Q-yed]WDF44720.1 DUF6153 family protein [Streptomyces sp. T12]